MFSESADDTTLSILWQKTNLQYLSYYVFIASNNFVHITIDFSLIQRRASSSGVSQTKLNWRHFTSVSTSNATCEWRLLLFVRYTHAVVLSCRSFLQSIYFWFLVKMYSLSYSIFFYFELHSHNNKKITYVLCIHPSPHCHEFIQYILPTPPYVCFLYARSW